MAASEGRRLPPLLGGARLVSCLDDDDFLAKLKERRWSVVFFAPGGCRAMAAGMSVPGNRMHTKGFGKQQYHVLVREHQGDNVPIVEAMDESEIVPRLQAALRLATAGASSNEVTERGQAARDKGVGNNSDKTILVRGCSAHMAGRSAYEEVSSPGLDGARMFSCLNDDDFLAKLKEKKWPVVFFAPGGCRAMTAGMSVPGSRTHTKAFGMQQYQALVREHQGNVPIVETTDEREIHPRLVAALAVA